MQKNKSNYVTDWNSVSVIVDYAFVCNLFGVSRQTVDRWASKGLIQKIVIDSGTVRFRKADLMKLCGYDEKNSLRS